VSTVELDFAMDLRPFLHRALRGSQPVRRVLAAKTSIKDVIESCGVPHTEVDLIVRGGDAAEGMSFGWQVMSDEEVRVFSAPAPIEVLPAVPRLQARGLSRFVADGHLGKLARDLRLLGFDTLFEHDADDARLLELVAGGDRALLTRDRRLLMHAIVRDGYCPRSTDPEQQTREVLRRFDLKRADLGGTAFRRCLRCNEMLEHVPKSAVLETLADEPLTLRHFDRFLRCVGCRQVYWPGTHFEKLTARVQRLLEG
jgi:uncharacterized protein with PIN domain